MKMAAIDVGTNSCRLLIAIKKNDDYKVLKKKLITTRLGEGVDNNKYLKKEAIDRTISALGKFNSLLNKYNVKKVGMVGTSALRDVVNSDVFVKKVNKTTGYNIKIISGAEEARLNYLGVKTDTNLSEFMVMDIGGGSTEFIWPEDGKINYKSINIGAVRLTERFIVNPSETVKYFEEKSMKEEIYDKISIISKHNLSKYELVGVGGTITTLGAMEEKLEEYKSEIIHNYKLNLDEVKEWQYRLKEMNINDRKKVKGLQPKRADIIVAGVTILQEFMKEMGYYNLYISERDILFGILERLTKQN
ncbi:MAG: Ppx/GppA family phosphatase [Halanaerobiales bacterium]